MAEDLKPVIEALNAIREQLSMMNATLPRIATSLEMLKGSIEKKK